MAGCMLEPNVVALANRAVAGILEANPKNPKDVGFILSDGTEISLGRSEYVEGDDFRHHTDALDAVGEALDQWLEDNDLLSGVDESEYTQVLDVLRQSSDTEAFQVSFGAMRIMQPFGTTATMLGVPSRKQADALVGWFYKVKERGLFLNIEFFAYDEWPKRETGARFETHAFEDPDPKEIVRLARRFFGECTCLDGVKTCSGPPAPPDKAELLRREAVDTFGTTGDYWLAGYMLPDGLMLDFSGWHYEKPPAIRQQRDVRPREYNRERQVPEFDVQMLEHLDVPENATNVEAVYQFMLQSGSALIEGEDESGYKITFATPPTGKQAMRLTRIFDVWHLRYPEVGSDLDEVDDDDFDPHRSVWAMLSPKKTVYVVGDRSLFDTDADVMIGAVRRALKKGCKCASGFEPCCRREE